MQTIKELSKQAKLSNNVTKLLSAGSTNYKTAKNKEKTFILYLAPYNQNNKGVNLCSKASEGCIKACLFSAGRGAFNSVKLARTNKANLYVENRILFLELLTAEILGKINYYAGKNVKLYFRLNGTSDIDIIGQIKTKLNVDLLSFENVYFYDYTAILGKVKKYLHTEKYVLTFSRKENNEMDCLQALKLGANVAAVFSGQLPANYAGYPVVSGDKTDIEMISFKSTILGLSAKGAAKKDNSGFVINN